MKIAAAILLLAITSPALAGSPYIEYKRVDAWKDTTYLTDVNYLRFGYTTGNLYLEVGPGYGKDYLNSWEAGYKFNITPSLQLKGKWEGVHNKDVAHKLETELRFTFH